jgi:hypothetical protein
MPHGKRRELARIVRENPLFSLTSPWANFDPTKRIEDLREFVEAGKAPAIFDALMLVIEHNVAIPNWLPPATQTYIEKTFKYTARGYRSKMLHFYRWRTVRRLLDERVAGWGEVFEVAESELSKTQYAGAAGTIADSYAIAARELADPEKALDYYTAMKPTRELVGTQLARWMEREEPPLGSRS